MIDARQIRDQILQKRDRQTRVSAPRAIEASGALLTEIRDSLIRIEGRLTGGQKDDLIVGQGASEPGGPTVQRQNFIADKEAMP